MPMTRDDVDALNTFVKAGRIDEARALLESLGGEKAAASLKRLNDRYPPVIKAARPAPRAISNDLPPELRLDDEPDEMEQIKTAIREKRFDDARAMLVLNDHPDADKMLARLSQLGSGDKPKRVDDDEGKDFSGRLSITILLLIFLTFFGLIALAIWLPDARRYPDAPGAKGLILANRVVTIILRAILGLLIFIIVVSVIVMAISSTQPNPYRR